MTLGNVKPRRKKESQNATSCDIEVMKLEPEVQIIDLQEDNDVNEGKDHIPEDIHGKEFNNGVMEDEDTGNDMDIAETDKPCTKFNVKIATMTDLCECRICGDRLSKKDNMATKHVKEIHFPDSQISEEQISSYLSMVNCFVKKQKREISFLKNAKFTQFLANFDKHNVIQTQKKCPSCIQTFNRPYGAYKHVWSMHYEGRGSRAKDPKFAKFLESLRAKYPELKKGTVCPLCGMKYSTSKLVTRHLKERHFATSGTLDIEQPRRDQDHFEVFMEELGKKFPERVKGECPLCGKKCRTEFHAKTHIKATHFLESKVSSVSKK